jgi:hypothetical protein
MKDNHAKAFRTATTTLAAVALTILSYSPVFGADSTAAASARPAKNMKSVRKPNFELDHEENGNPGGDGMVIFIGLAKPPDGGINE